MGERPNGQGTSTGAARRTGRRFTGVRALVTGVAVLGTALLAFSSGTAGAAPTEDDVTIVQTLSGATTPCVDPGSSRQTGDLTADVEDTATNFVVTVNLQTDFCNPIEVKAAIYSMPSAGGSWPQNLAVVKSFTLDEAGTTVITFTKGCEPVQFDVLTGSTPSPIHPDFGVMHGPLLFPSTALMHFGVSPCATTPTTSTIFEPTPTVLGSTTVVTTTTTAPPVSVAPTSTPPAAVEGIATVRQPPAAAPAGTEGGQVLALTGPGGINGLIVAGVLLLALGAAFVVAQRGRLPEQG